MLAAAARAERRDGVHESVDLLGGDAAVEGDALDLVVAQPLDQLAHAALALGIGVGHDQLVADDADGDRGHLLLQDLEGGEQPVDVAAEER